MEDKDLYVLAVMRYKEENPSIDSDLLFPLNWNLSDDYHLKIEIIADAIDKHILIHDTELYRNKFNIGDCQTLSNISFNDQNNQSDK